jgi:hypothetical protein
MKLAIGRARVTGVFGVVPEVAVRESNRHRFLL